MHIDRKHLEGLSFHESTLETIVHDDTRAVLGLSGVARHDDKVGITLELKGVREIRRDGAAIERLEMESSDAEVLSLVFGNQAIHLILEWNDFAPRSSKVCRYDLSYESVTLEVIEC